MAERYERDPARIYAESFRIIRAEADLSGWPAGDAALAMRMIHACGMPDIAADLRIAPAAVPVGKAALSGGATIWCDTEMVAHGVVRRSLPPCAAPRVTLGEPAVAGLARRLTTTRSAAATELWKPLAGAIVAIGNAPTALFHLLDGVGRGWPKPALIVGVPVGFVGAAESKARLAAGAHGVPFVTLLGRRGGSALAAAAVNALALGAEAPAAETT